MKQTIKIGTATGTFDVPDQPMGGVFGSALATGYSKPSKMNKLEMDYAAHLQYMVYEGAVRWWAFEAIKLRLADETFYEPDFLVLPTEGPIEVHETKGFWRDDARVKIKVAAEMFPFRFIGVTKKDRKEGGGWRYEYFR